MEVKEYRELRDLKIKELCKQGTDPLEIRGIFGVDDELIREVCKDVIKRKIRHFPKKRGSVVKP